MPYISADQANEIRKELKATFPATKFSVKIESHMALTVSVMASQFGFQNGKYREINHYYLTEENYTREEIAFLEKVMSICTKSQRIINEDYDYGSIPNFYFHLRIGKWNQHHIQKN